MFDTVKRRLLKILGYNGIKKQAREEVLEELNESFLDYYNYPLYDDDEAKWVQIAGNKAQVDLEINNETTLKSIRDLSKHMALFNPYAKNILRNLVKFIMTKGFSFDFAYIDANFTLSEAISTAARGNVRKPGRARTSADLNPNSAVDYGYDEKQAQVIKMCYFYWYKFYKNNNLNIKLKEIVKRTFRDGEVFLRFFAEGDNMTFRFIDPDFILDNQQDGASSWGIETLPNDVETPLFYYVTVDGVTEKVPANEIIHIKLSDSDQKRGIPFLLAVLKRLKQHDTWLEDRMALNKLRASIGLIRKWSKTGKSEIEKFADSNKTRTDYSSDSYRGGSEAVRRQTFRRGSILDVTNNVDYEFLAPNLQASDVAQDGRSILVSVAAGVSLPEYMVTSDASNANYGSTLVSESPATFEFQDWQDFFSTYFSQFWDKLRDYLLAINKLPEEAANIDMFIEPTNIITRDKLKETQSNEILYLNKIISRKTWSAKEGINFDKNQKEIEEESFFTDDQEANFNFQDDDDPKNDNNQDLDEDDE